MRTVLIAIVALLWVAAPGFANQGVLMVTSVKGKAAVSEDGSKWTAAAVLKPLQASTQIKVTEGTLEVAVFKTGSRLTVVAPATVKVSAAGLEMVQGKPDQLVAKAVRKTASGKAVKPVGVSMGGHLLRAAGDYFILSAGTVRSPKPRLVWTAAPGQTSYQVELMDDLGDSVWKGVVQGTEMDYPAAAPAIGAGDFYTVRVSVYDPAAGAVNPQVVAAETEITSLDQSVRADLEALEKVLDANDPSDLAVLASHYLQHQLYLDALRAGQKLSRLQPDNPGAYRYLFKVCAALEMSEKAKEYEKLAVEKEQL